MVSKTIKKPFYIAAVTLFASTALLAAKPVTSHADVTPNETVTSASQYNGLSNYQKELASFNTQSIKAFNPNQGNTNYNLGLADGFNNVTADGSNGSEDYSNGYITGQYVAQGWIVAAGGLDPSHIPYVGSDMNKLSAKDIQTNKDIKDAYVGFTNGLKAYINKDKSEPTGHSKYYDLAYAKGYDYGENPYDPQSQNDTAFGDGDDNTIAAYRADLHETSLGAYDTTSADVNSGIEAAMTSNDIQANADKQAATQIHTTVKKQSTKKKVVKKHVKKTTKKHAKKRHVVKKHVKKSHKKFPKTVYAKHRTGVHSVPQFNHGKTHYVAKGHKFHVYDKVSDGHGNWRYKVGKHAYITTIPGSIGTHKVRR